MYGVGVVVGFLFIHSKLFNMKNRIQVIGNKILTASDLEEMNAKEIKNRKYTHCTIDSGEYGQFLAKVGYSEISKAWEPTEILFEGNWISAYEFDDMPGYNTYGCENYRCQA